MSENLTPLSELVTYGPEYLVSTKSHIFQATLGLRIKAGKLQQLWVGMSHGEHDWRDVPVEE